MNIFCYKLDLFYILHEFARFIFACPIISVSPCITNKYDSKLFYNISSKLNFLSMMLKATFISSYDSLVLYVGHPILENLIAKYCGNNVPANYISSNNKIYIRFHSDGVYTRSGFKLKYNPYSKNIFNMQTLSCHL